VCNPPYISSGRLTGDRAPLLRHEPREAFDAGPYGLSIHQRLVTEAARYLRRDGWLLCEFGSGQAKQIKILFDRSRRYAGVRMIPDDAGEERVAAARSLG
jgi:release factor glutamine methyltransferase